MTGSNFVTLEFTNNLKDKLQPIEIVAEIETKTYGKSTETISQTPINPIIGHREGGAVRVTMFIEDGQLIANYEGLSSNVINVIGTIQILKLTTTNFVYSEFQFD